MTGPTVPRHTSVHPLRPLVYVLMYRSGSRRFSKGSYTPTGSYGNTAF